MHGNTKGLLGLLYTCQLLIEINIENNTSSSNSSSNNASSSGSNTNTNTNTTNTQNESENDSEKSIQEEAKVTLALYEWCKEQLELTQTNNTSNDNSIQFSKTIFKYLKELL